MRQCTHFRERLQGWQMTITALQAREGVKSNHLILCKMPVEFVHLVEGHEIQHLLDEGDAEVMSPHIEQNSPP